MHNHPLVTCLIFAKFYMQVASSFCFVSHPPQLSLTIILRFYCRYENTYIETDWRLEEHSIFGFLYKHILSKTIRP